MPQPKIDVLEKLDRWYHADLTGISLVAFGEDLPTVLKEAIDEIKRLRGVVKR
jgi:hypothetical protein